MKKMKIAKTNTAKENVHLGNIHDQLVTFLVTTLMPKIIAFSGSPRKNGYTVLVQEI